MYFCYKGPDCFYVHMEKRIDDRNKLFRLELSTVKSQAGLVTSSNTSRLEANAGFFRLLMKGIFDPYVLWPFDKKLISFPWTAHAFNFITQ